jgi:hypothetical protein
MKTIIDLLEGALSEVNRANGDNKNTRLDNAADIIREVVSLLKAPPRRETPEQYRERTGRDWPDDWGVYSLYETIGRSGEKEKKWFCECYDYAKTGVDCYDYYGETIRLRKPLVIICATEAGCPPADWKPEGTQ